MISLLIVLTAAIAQPASSIAEISDATEAPIAEGVGEQPPMTIDRWNNLTPEGRKAYAQVTVEALKWSTAYAACDELTSEALITHIEAAVALQDKPVGPLLMPVAVAVQVLCPASGV